MSNPPQPGSPERNALLLDFPARLYTAMRTIRLYPPTNPQVQRSNEFVMQALQALLAAEDGDSINLALLEGRLMVCGEQLPDKEQARPQIQGLVTLMQRLKIHSLSFHSTFSPSHCVDFIQILAELGSEREPSETLAARLERAGIDSVAVDTKRYVAIGEGEQVVREEMLIPGLAVSDADMVSYIQGKGLAGAGFAAAIPAELEREFSAQLATAKGGREVEPAELGRAVRDVLETISNQPTGRQAEDVRLLAHTLVDLDPVLLAGVMSDLPAAKAADDLLGAVLRQMPLQRLDALVAALSSQQRPGGSGQVLEKVRFLSRLVSLEAEEKGAGPSAEAGEADAQKLLLDPETRLGDLPDQVLQRLRDPNWSASMLASTVQQMVNQSGDISREDFNRLLVQYEGLLSQQQLAQVVRQAGAELASMDGLALGNVLAQRFKGLLGEQLYEQILSQVSDDLLDETVEHLTPKQLNRMVATLISDIPLQIGKDQDPDFKPADDSVLKRLAQTSKAPEVNRAIAQNVDARQLLLNPATTLAELPDHLVQRLRDPEWSAPVIANAAQQVMDTGGLQAGGVSFEAFNRLLAQYEELLSRDQQAQVARRAGAELASLEGLELGNILAQRFKGLFGEQLYRHVLTQVSDDLLDETVEHLTPKQLNRMVATLISDIPLQIGKDQDPDFKPADDAVLKRLAQTSKAAEVNRAIAQNVDAFRLLLNPETRVADLPAHLLERLRDPDWSAPVIVSAAQQVVDAGGQQAGGVSFEAFNHLLAQYDQLLSREQQAQVAHRAGAELASLEGLELGNILAQRFRGLFGEQLYRHVLTQVSDDLLDETVEHLTPKQLNRMVATLISDIPLQIGKEQDPDFKPADDTVLKRLAQTSKATEVNRAIAQNVDARQLLLNPATTLAELPAHLLERLRDPDWSAPVIASAAQQVADPGLQQAGGVSFEAFNRLLAQYDELLNRDQQTQVARRAGAELASLEGIELGNILAQRFRGLFGEQLYRHVLTQVSDDLLDETVEHLTPKQLNRMVATLISDIPLQIGKDQDPDFKPADDSVLKRLAQTSKAPEVNRAIAQNVDARRLLLNPETRLADLPEHLLDRLRDPNWATPVIASAAQQAADAGGQQAGGVSFEAFNQLLAQYEDLLSREEQSQVARQVGADLASLEGLALGTILAQRFKGLFGEQLYQHILSQVSDDLLDETIEHLTPKQINRMIATLTCDIPLQVGKEAHADFVPADDSVLKRLAQGKKGPQLTRMIAQHIDAHALQTPPEQCPELPQRLQMRLQQPAWSAPVLITAVQQAADAVNQGDQADLANFDRLIDRYDTLLNREKQLQVATQAGAGLAKLEERELGLVLVRKYKNLFGEQLYQQVIAHLTDDKFEQLARRLRAVSEGKDDPALDVRDQDAEEAYNRLMRTVRGEKMRTIIEMHREQKLRREEQRQETVRGAVDAILQGRIEEIEKTAVARELPEVVRNLLNEGKENEADSLLMQLAVGLQHKNAVVRANAIRTLAAVAEHLAATGQWQRLTRLLPALEQGLQKPEIGAEAISQTVQAIGTLAGHHLTREEYGQAQEMIHRLQTSADRMPTESKQGPQVREAIADTLRQISTLPVLEHLLDRYLHSDAHREKAGKLLAGLGKPSAQFQLQQLMSNESSFERRRLLELIRLTGSPALAILREQLHHDSPWYVLRNIIRLLGEMGNPDLFPHVRPFLDYSDARVQREVISTAMLIGGEDIRDFLLQALQQVPDSLKTKVVNHVATHHDERFVRPLTDLLESTKPFQGKSKADLQIAICKTLAAIGSKRATPALARVAESKNILGLGGYPDEVRQAAAMALSQIKGEGSARVESATPGGDDEPAAPDETEPTAAVAWEAMTNTAAEEAAIFALAAQGQQVPAKQRLIELIAAMARAGNFREAERLRERIYEIDPMALAEIIRAGEIIEQEKKGAIKEEDLTIWARLTDRLSSEEFQTIYHEFNERRYKPEETIVSQGDKNDELFFINQGSVKVSHMTGPRELFITTLNRGQIAGENFFTPSFWTVSLTSLTPSRIYVLQQSALQTWQERFPGLRAKLYEFYTTSNDIHAMLDRKGLERRRDQRFKLARKIQVQPINAVNAPIGRGFRAETADISVGGLAFLIRISKQENARLLLGRRMQVVLPVAGPEPYLYLRGLVIGIQPFHILDNDFSVHFRFDQPLEAAQLQTILG